MSEGLTADLYLSESLETIKDKKWQILAKEEVSKSIVQRSINSKY